MSSHAQILPNEEEIPFSTPIFRPTAARGWTPSFSSSEYSSESSSFSLNNEDQYPLFSPSTSLKFKGIPFSWEQIPGIPKRQLGATTTNKKEYSEEHDLLPLPPAAGNSNSSAAAAAAKKLLHHEEISPKKSNRFQWDPFYEALVQCSKDDHYHDHDHHHWKGSSKITRTLSDRFGFINMYTSCKRTCTVSESIVYLPRPSPHYLLNRRSS